MSPFEKELVDLIKAMLRTLEELEHDTVDYEIMLSMIRAKYSKWPTYSK